MRLRRHLAVLPHAAIGELHLQDLARGMVADRADVAGADLLAFHLRRLHAQAHYRMLPAAGNADTGGAPEVGGTDAPGTGLAPIVASVSGDRPRLRKR